MKLNIDCVRDVMLTLEEAEYSYFSIHGIKSTAQSFLNIFCTTQAERRRMSSSSGGAYLFSTIQAEKTSELM